MAECVNKHECEIDLGDAFGNGLFWIYSKATGKPCIMDTNHQGKQAVLVFVSQEKAQAYLAMVKQHHPIRLNRFPIRHTPVGEIFPTLHSWRCFANHITFPRLGETDLSHQVLSIEQL